jgi:hypothetical protein
MLKCIPQSRNREQLLAIFLQTPWWYKLPDESNPNGIGYDQISNNRKKLPTKAIEKIDWTNNDGSLIKQSLQPDFNQLRISVDIYFAITKYPTPFMTAWNLYVNRIDDTIE